MVKNQMQDTDHGTQSPLHYENRLKSYGLDDWYIGTTTSVRKTDINRWLKGDIGKVCMWNRVLSEEEIKNIHKNVPEKNLVLHYDFNSDLQKDSPYTTKVDLSETNYMVVLEIVNYTREK